MSKLDLPEGLPEFIKSHLKLYLETDGREGHMWQAPGLDPLPTLLLTTQGRHSGRSRILPLIYGRHGDDYVVVASKGGAPLHPAWYLNLAAEPEVGVQVARDKFRARARTSHGDERSSLWEEMAQIYSPYNDYQENAGSREIPVVVLERFSE
ncbi:MAG: nitroreductase/quinone reductase family protein [Myxococcota bacterium]|nr:nitroreductase [Spirochaeta sp.]RPG12475.1 MAG: nitroreductase family deazaflavin-dependent oxidoreductase [Proteobacteria bacterium TMED72]